ALAAGADAGVVVPPSDLHRHLAELLWSKEGADVVIELDGGDGETTTFHAHRWVLAARSPVLKAKLSASPSSPATLRLAAMDADAFRALLHFIYTDTLPDDDDDDDAMARRLLAAADAYGMERLRLICEDRLRRRVAMGNVAVTLALAEQHHCRALKEACVEFLSSPGNLKAAMATDGFEHLKATCPSVLTELVMKQLV
ncbi:Os11g0629600, partial [Oryza sativa Japonica Group]